ncbi:hypothetical protein [Burkholderia ubonensis]|uniref:hypothetical protein n=1 Tax=Burkholderia ubonensis TaxID=101571 RepID=UPI00076C3E5A|nr:hypothetical protein [Burkholderia ubonensis]KVZ59649.1 hypothetical protein WL20_19820 [Burkholderia ubonensis]
MKIQEKDFYHGAALTQITEHPSFKALNTANMGNYGHYLVNTDTHVFVKYRTGPAPAWNHVFSVGELKALQKLRKKTENVWIALVCGDATVCLLDSNQTDTLLDLDDEEQQRIKVEVPNGGSCRVSGSAGDLKRVVRHNDFPARLFE